MTTMWPLGVLPPDAERCLIDVARVLTAAGDQDANIEELVAALDKATLNFFSISSMLQRLTSWRAACLVAGALPTAIEIRIDVLVERTKNKYTDRRLR